MADPAPMGRLAVIAPWTGRHANTLPILRRVLLESTRPPDELWLVCETQEDVAVAMNAAGVLEVSGLDSIRFCHLPTPRDADGKWTVVPYSYATNYALDRTTCDLICYLTNDSMPEPTKYEVMAAAMAANPEWRAGYCGQRRNGRDHPADRVLDSAFAVLDHTQVMHRATDARWRLGLGDLLLGDAHFWNDLGGPFHPIDGGILDVTDQTPDGITRSRV